MGIQYQQVSIEERCEIARLRTAGHSVRQIAASLDRERHQQWLGVEAQWVKYPGLPASLSEQQAQARRWRGSRLERYTPMCEAVLSCLSQGWSPEQAAGRFARESGHPVISHESIYRFTYAQLARKKDYSCAITCPGPSPNAAGGDARAAVPHPSSPSEGPWPNAPKQLQTARPQATGRPT